MTGVTSRETFYSIKKFAWGILNHVLYFVKIMCCLVICCFILFSFAKNKFDYLFLAHAAGSHDPFDQSNCVKATRFVSVLK